jgi:hypothetical protein
MDTSIVEAISDGCELPKADTFPNTQLVIARGARGEIVSVGEQVEIEREGAGSRRLALRPIRQLFAGDGKAPDLSGGPTPKLEPFFVLLELTVASVCAANGRDATDQEMEHIYSEMRRRPDGEGGVLRSYVRAAARLYLSMNNVSQSEYEAVFRRLTKSARTFAGGSLSRNYLFNLRKTIGQ